MTSTIDSKSTDALGSNTNHLRSSLNYPSGMYGGGNAMSYVDQMLMFQSISILQNIFERKAFTLQNLCLIIILLSFDAIRKAIVQFVTTFDILNMSKTLLQKVSIFLRRRNNHNEEYKHDFTPYTVLNFNASTTFWEGVLTNTNRTDVEFQYTKTNEKTLTQKNMYEYKITEIYTNVSFIHDAFQAHFKQSFNVIKSVIHGHSKIESISCTNCEPVIRNVPSATTFSDILPFPVFSKELRKVVETTQDIHLNLIKKDVLEFFKINQENENNLQAYFQKKMFTFQTPVGVDVISGVCVGIGAISILSLSLIFADEIECRL